MHPASCAVVLQCGWCPVVCCWTTQLRGAANSRPSVRGRRRSFLLDTFQNVTIDHSQADVINNTYTDRLMARITAGMEAGGGFPLQSVPFVNAALFKEQLSRQRFRITQSKPKVLVHCSRFCSLLWNAMSFKTYHWNFTIKIHISKSDLFFNSVTNEIFFIFY